MIYGQDEAMLFPTMDLYDKGLMQMYINAVKDQYDQGIKDYDKFISTYGDFVSPFAKDVDYWNATTMDPVTNLINDFYSQGIDPTRSPEARAALQRTMRNIPYGKLAQMRASAKAADEYLKNRGNMAAKGLYNSDFENFILTQNGMPDFEHWDTLDNGVWTRTSPSEYKDLNQWTSHIFDDMKGQDLGIDPTGRYRIFGVDQAQMDRNLTPQIYGLLGSDLGRYYYNKAKESLAATGNNNPSETDIISQLKGDIITANKERMWNKYDTDDYAKSDYDFSHQMQMENVKHAHDKEMAALNHYYNMQEIPLKNSSKSSSSGSGGSSGTGKPEGEEFDFAQRSYDSALANAASSNLIQYQWYNMDSNSYSQIGKDLFARQYQFSRSLAGKTNAAKYKAYEKRYTTPLDRQSFVKFHGGSTVSGNNMVIQASEGDIDRIYSEQSVINNTAGSGRNAKQGNSSTIRNAIKTTGVDNTTITPLGKQYGALMTDGTFKVYAKVKITVTPEDENEQPKSYYGYYDMGIYSGQTSGGAWVKNVADPDGDVIGKSYVASGKYRRTNKGGLIQTQSGSSRFNLAPVKLGESRPNFIITTPAFEMQMPEYEATEYNVFPDYEKWLSFGPGSVRVNKELAAKATVDNAGY